MWAGFQLALEVDGGFRGVPLEVGEWGAAVRIMGGSSLVFRRADRGREGSRGQLRRPPERPRSDSAPRTVYLIRGDRFSDGHT